MFASVQNLVSTLVKFKPRADTAHLNEQTATRPTVDLDFTSKQIQSILGPREQFLVSASQQSRGRETHPTLILFQERGPWRFIFEDTLVLPDDSCKLQRCITVRLSIGMQAPFVIRCRWLYDQIIWEDLAITYSDRFNYEEAMEAIETIGEDALALPFDAIACAYQYFEEHSLAT